jgi:hypothetical protein
MLRRNEALRLDLGSRPLRLAAVGRVGLPNWIAMASTTLMRTAQVKRRHR